MNVSWQDFEVECTNYLNQTYGKPDEIVFLHMGKTDSTVSDIRVDINHVPKFYIEVKMSTSQCGQFVLLPDSEHKKFNFSPKNNSTETPATRKIISYMNQHFDDLAGGGILEMQDSVYYEWVTEHYKNLGAKYLITASSDHYITASSDHYIIFPIDKFANYFGIKAKYRVKRSGSRSPSKVQRIQVINFLKSHIPSFSYIIQDNDLIVKGDNLKEKERFAIDDNTYYLTNHPAGYRVRILSKTANLNVIFSIVLKKSQQNPVDLAKFIEDLK